VVVPTRNEADNVDALLKGIQAAVGCTPIEVIFVDDSTDDTPQVVETAVGRFPDLNVHLIHRDPPERAGGLGGAVVAGLRAARSEYACIMDGDLQHPPELLPVLLRTAQEKHADLVVASRRIADSQVAGLNTARNLISRSLDLLARAFFPGRLRGVSDPLTGFFLVRVPALNLDQLRPKGFKILLEILVRNPKLRKAEVPFRFGERLAGQSKASASEVWKYFSLLWGLRFGESSLRFIGFALVGLSGVGVNTLALYLATERLHIFYLLSAAIATLASTLWNFSITEALVYRSEARPLGRAQGRMGRFGLFFVMNTLALSLRSPIIYALTSLAGLHYVLSNLISLALLTVVRFIFADNIIWGQGSGQVPRILSNSIFKGKTMKRTYAYNIHNIIRVVSEGELPELEPFQVMDEIENPTIRVRIGNPRRSTPEDEKTGRYLNYHEVFGRLGFEVGIEFGEQVNVTASPSLKRSPHVLYTNVVEPILRWTFVRKGYALVHGATIAFGDQAYMITARTDTGKTTTLLKILSHQRRDRDRAAFISDDMTIVSPDGLAMTYPKPMTISYHTLHAVNADTLNFKERLFLPFQSRIHSKSGRRMAFFISKTHLPAATINLVVQMLVPPPKYYVQKLIPKVKLARKGTLTGMFVIERGDGENAGMENSEAMEVLLENCEDAYGFPPYDALKEFLYHADGVDLREKEHAIIRQALGHLPATRVRSKNLDWWCRIPTYVDQQVAKDCSCDGDRVPRTFRPEPVGAD
jgi:glycosyltransferase involved in cell wall biosynthesis